MAEVEGIETPQNHRAQPNEAGSRVSVSRTHSVVKLQCEVTERVQKILGGLALAMIVSVSWVGCTLFAQKTLTSNDTFNAPLMFVYFCSSWMMVFYPGYCLIAYAYSRGKLKPKLMFRESLKLYNLTVFKASHFFGKSLMFCFVWTAANYTYVRGLQQLSAVDVITLFSTNQSFVYLLSWIVLFEQFVAIRIIAMIFSITGIVLFAYVDGFASSSMWGVVLAVASGAGAAVYKVLFKKFVGDASYGQVSFFLSLLGLGNFLLLWPLVLVLYFTKVETINWSAAPWHYACGSATLAVVYQYLVNYGVSMTYPIFLGIGIVIGIPLCAIADIIWKSKYFPGMEVAATILIVIGLLLILLPDNWWESLLKACACKRRPELPMVADTPRSRLRVLHTGL